MGFEKHKLTFFKLIKVNPTPHHFSLQAKKCIKKTEFAKGWNQKASELSLSLQKVNSYGFSFFQLTKNQIEGFELFSCCKMCWKKYKWA